MLVLFPFHTLRVFNADDPWYVKADTLSLPVTYLLEFVSVWHRQLLFLLAGASPCFALRRRSSRRHVGERLLCGRRRKRRPARGVEKVGQAATR